ncbi:MAG: carbohydrate ABC transporter permease [Clostridia bacterium]|nr:carbohydrate ABC transporter permease [Clostridia bacterium]
MKRVSRAKIFVGLLFAALSVIYLWPLAVVLLNSFKSKAGISAAPFSLPDADSFVGLENFITGMTFGNYPFYKSVLFSFVITLLSVALILLCTSMCAWFLSRRNTRLCRILYLLFVFSMIVPFQMVMYTLSKTADELSLNTPWTIPVIYLGFGAGLAVFMFTGFVKGMPLEMEEAAAIDGCSVPRTFFGVVLPIMRPTLISVAILQTMWIWNDYLLPYLVLDLSAYKTIPIHIQYLNGSYGQRDIGAIMALILLSLLPVVIFYFTCQKYIIKGVMAGAVKG